MFIKFTQIKKKLMESFKNIVSHISSPKSSTEVKMSKPKIKSYKFHVGLFGPSGVGKSTFGKKLTDDPIGGELLSTELMSEFPPITKIVKSQNRKYHTRTWFWDFGGQDYFFPKIEEGYGELLTKLSAVLYFVDVSRPETLSNLPRWIEMVRKYNPNCKSYLIVNKDDLPESSKLLDDLVIDEFADNFGMNGWYRISALKLELDELLDDILEHPNEKEEKNVSKNRDDNCTTLFLEDNFLQGETTEDAAGGIFIYRNDPEKLGSNFKWLGLNLPNGGFDENLSWQAQYCMTTARFLNIKSMSMSVRVKDRIVNMQYIADDSDNSIMAIVSSSYEKSGILFDVLNDFSKELDSNFKKIYENKNSELNPFKKSQSCNKYFRECAYSIISSVLDMSGHSELELPISFEPFGNIGIKMKGNYRKVEKYYFCNKEYGVTDILTEINKKNSERKNGLFIGKEGLWTRFVEHLFAHYTIVTPFNFVRRQQETVEVSFEKDVKINFFNVEFGLREGTKKIYFLPEIFGGKEFILAPGFEEGGNLESNAIKELIKEVREEMSPECNVYEVAVKLKKSNPLKRLLSISKEKEMR